jgi:hypothetical protein
MNCAAHALARRPNREIRARHTGDTITLYQAYSHEIADAAVAAQTFVPPFKRGRMTWVKPSFLWMMYRAGWAAKDAGQARVLALTLARPAFEAALRQAQLSHFDARVHGPAAQDAWERARKAAPPPDVVLQWDPERDARGRGLDWRSLQLGLRGAAVDAYVDEWIVRIEDVTPLVREIKDLLDAGREEEAYARMPREEVFRVPEDIAKAIGMDIEGCSA